MNKENKNKSKKISKKIRAENETRTRDPNLGKVVLYQLSYFRSINMSAFAVSKRPLLRPSFKYVSPNAMQK